MSRLTKLMGYPFPSEGDDPYFDIFLATMANLDAADYAYADDQNLILTGNAFFTWSAGTSILTWDSNFFASGYTSGFRAVFPGPSAITINDGEVVFFTMPRLLTADTPTPLQKDVRVAQATDGIKLHEKLVVCVRSGTQIYFRNGVTLTDGFSGFVWERPANPALIGLTVDQRAVINSALHEHIWLLFEQPATPVGTSVFTLPTPPFQFGSLTVRETYRQISVYRNGVMLARTDNLVSRDYAANLTGTANIFGAPYTMTLVRPTAAPGGIGDRIQVELEQSVTAPTT